MQCGIATEIGQLMLAKKTAEHFGGHLVGEDGQEFDRFIENSLPEEMVEKTKVKIRKTVAEDINDIEEKIESYKDQIAANSRSCSGPLNMRAVKNGVSYTATICTSARVHVKGKHQYLPTRITVD